jgi:hypothetical protein
MHVSRTYLKFSDREQAQKRRGLKMWLLLCKQEGLSSNPRPIKKEIVII